MDKLQITGGIPLQGTVTASGAKNAVLPILAATLLTPEACQIDNVPSLRDVYTTQALLEQFGVKAVFSPNHLGQGQFSTNAATITHTTAPYDLVKTMRASVLVMGPLLGRFHEVSVSLPGGCAIGARPIDQHLKGFEAMGAQITINEGYVQAKAPKGLVGARIVMDIVTVTGTENLLMAAVLAKGTTVLENAAREPEVDDLANMLNAMGAKITGIGSDTLVIEGVSQLRGCQYSVMPDRIETATFLVAAAMTQGFVKVEKTNAKILDSALAKLKQAGAEVAVGPDWISLDMRNKRIMSVDIRTAPFPGFPTDLQAQFMALNTLGTGASTVVETIFENRFMHVPELIRLGAKISVDGRSAVIEGVEELHAAPVMATDLRASASLVLAALAAKGTTVIDRVYHLDRGYEKIEDKLSQLGADVCRLAS
ncbi:UDP-N-acetylglucosamine 1-carboxyvinyltransferase [Ostreibacterium oceani]|uniref:UDP-N-acetylglucosamine 1-carboxyvinyltransferase n=1 Tax=Ostreibacterium oceani TaxID=2654998 RepID=A0A6N7EYQ7_9GAMM|nr:UDP-N-acetylglucosamine 1-carboxyvinyltransferase [Ostreibacterium oceani]MPV86690.1 UDP-N-acetylglucosamine 1-carboxyvinyltransferase [Ostreibacterium oceani]